MMPSIEMLEKSQWLRKFSHSFKEDLIKLMIPFDAPEGHVFIREGEPINSFLVVQEGILQRTRRPEGEGDPIKIDEINPGQVSGFLHVAGSQDEEVAFATITAKSQAKVWVVSGGHFRKMCENNPKYASEVIHVLSLVLRSTTKIVRATINTHPSEHEHEKEKDSIKKKVLKVLCYDTTSWVKENFEPQIEAFNKDMTVDLKVQMDYTQDRLDVKTAKFAAGYDAVCLFVNDTADADTIYVLSMCGVSKEKSESCYPV